MAPDMENCLFCQIIAGKIPSEKVMETAHFVAFKDIHPKAPVHVLIVPKHHRMRPEELTADEITAMLAGTEEIAQILGVKDTGYRLVFNVGNHPGQEIDHVHLHLIGGAPAKSMY
jgi:histidine triad (HIT) family protein